MPGMPDALKGKMEKQGYHFVGKHSAVKICEYTANGLRGGILCYKHTFYGIRSWQCVQSTPAIGCDISCKFCWRIIPEELGFEWNELNAIDKWDDPEFVIENMIKEQRRIVSGYKAIADTDLKKRRWDEANKPIHVAMSLTGEPTFYPKMSKLIEGFHRRGISTFLVTNGTLSEAIESMNPLPTQLYISLQAPNYDSYIEVTRPKIKNTWDRYLKSLELLSTLNTRTVLRMTLVKGLNMKDPEGYANLIKLGNPQYVEVKGFSYVGSAREEQRGLSMNSIPQHDEIQEFAKKIAELTGYIFTAEHKPSRVVLLCRDQKAKDNRIIDFSQIGKEYREVSVPNNVS